jgi:hypothetical protein
MAIPIKIGNYKLGKTLGSGSFGKVKGIITYFLESGCLVGINEITN